MQIISTNNNISILLIDQSWAEKMHLTQAIWPSNLYVNDHSKYDYVKKEENQDWFEVRLKRKRAVIQSFGLHENTITHDGA